MRILLCDSRIRQIYAVKFISNDYYERSYQNIADIAYFERIFRTIISNVYFERLFRTTSMRFENESRIKWNQIFMIFERCAYLKSMFINCESKSTTNKTLLIFLINFYFKNNECKLIDSFIKKEFRFRLLLIMIQCDDENYDDFKSHFFSTHES